MANLYTNENVPLEVVAELRRLGHEVLTSFDAGNANAGIPDHLVLAFANSVGRVIVTNNRRDFIRLHRRGDEHAGIVVFTFHPDPIGIAGRISAALAHKKNSERFLVRVDGEGFTVDP